MGGLDGWVDEEINEFIGGSWIVKLTARQKLKQIYILCQNVSSVGEGTVTSTKCATLKLCSPKNKKEIVFICILCNVMLIKIPGSLMQ